MRVWVKRGILAALADFAFSAITNAPASADARRRKRSELVISPKAAASAVAEKLESAGRALVNEFRTSSGTEQEPAPGSASCQSRTNPNWAAEMDARLQPQLLSAEPSLGLRRVARIAPCRFGFDSANCRGAASSRVGPCIRRPSSPIDLGFHHHR